MAKMPASVLDFFEQFLPDLLQNHIQKAKEIGGVYAFELLGEEGGNFTIDLTSDPPKVVNGLQSNIQCSIVMESSDFLQLLGDPTMAPVLFTKGKLKVKGNPMYAMKIQKLFTLTSP